MKLPSIRHSRLYNAIIKMRRQNSSKVSGVAKNKRPKKPIATKFPRLYLFILIGLILLASTIPVIKVAWDYGHLELISIADNYSIEDRNFEIENQAFYLVSTEVGSNKRFIDGIYVFSFNHSSKELSIISVSPDFVIYVPYLSKTLGLRTVYNNATAVDKEPWIAVNSAVKTLLGISVQGYTAMDNKDLADAVQILRFSNNNKESSLVKQIESVNIINWLSLYTNIKQIASKVSTTSSANSLIAILSNMDNYKLRQSIQIGNSFGVGYAPDLNLINQALVESMRLTPVLAEQIKVEVFNASGQPGLAGRISRLLSNYGVNVVRFSNAPRTEEKTTLYLREEVEAPLNISIIKNLIRTDFQVSQENYEYNSTGDLVLILGQDAY